MKSKSDLLNKMLELKACEEATVWVSKQKGTAQQIWAKCNEPEWLIWFAGRMDADRKDLVRVACLCARTTLQFIPEGEDRPRLAIETTERWLEGKATLAEVKKAAHNTYYASARHAAIAAHAANDATTTTYYATYAAIHATYAAATYATTTTTQLTSKKKLAKLVRSVFPKVSKLGNEEAAT